MKNKKFHFELLTRKLSFSFFTFNLLTQSWKYLFSLRVNNSMVKLLFFGFWVTNSGLKNKRSNFELLTPWVTFYFFTYEFHLREIDKWKKIQYILQFQCSWTLRNQYHSLFFLRTSYSSMSWGFSGMLKCRSDMDVVSNRWEPIWFLFRGYISLGSRDIQVQSFDPMTSS